jgi:adenylate cyclase class 2
MHEIEVKAALKNKVDFIGELAKRGCELGPVITQDDTIYVRETGTLEVYLSNSDFLRIRVEGSGRILFTFKHHAGRIVNLDSAPFEMELEVSSRETMEQILSHMGYKEAARVKKQRQKGRYEKWEICVDDVEGFGSFVELEELSSVDDDISGIQKHMQEVLSELGVDANDFIKNRYDVMLLQKHSK